MTWEWVVVIGIAAVFLAVISIFPRRREGEFEKEIREQLNHFRSDLAWKIGREEFARHDERNEALGREFAERNKILWREFDELKKQMEGKK